MNERNTSGVIVCNGCGWSWDIATGGEDPYDCHKCGNKNNHLDEMKKNKVKRFGEFLNEVSRSPVSGTKAGWIDSLEDKKYELTKDVKGAQIGDFTNVTLPKGTIIYNLPGGVFADHFSLKNTYTSRSSQGPQWFDKPSFKGVSIRRNPDTLAAIEKNGKVLEAVVNEELLNPGNLPDVPQRLVDMIESNGHVMNRIIVHLEGGELDGWYDYNRGFYSDFEWEPMVYSKNKKEQERIIFDQDVIEDSAKEKPCKEWKKWLIGMSKKKGFAFKVKEVYLGET